MARRGWSPRRRRWRPTIILSRTQLRIVDAGQSRRPLGVVRSFGAHCILARQSAGDLEAFANISPAEVRGAVVDNTTLKFIYRVTDGEHAEAIAKAAGSRRTFTEVPTKGVDEDGAHGVWQTARRHGNVSRRAQDRDRDRAHDQDVEAVRAGSG